jgi:hypothetical protein
VKKSAPNPHGVDAKPLLRHVEDMKKSRFLTALALCASITSQIESFSQTAPVGTILITTRKGQDLTFGYTDAGDAKGPGQASQGDVAMAALLGDYGYASRILLDVGLEDATAAYLAPGNPLFNPILIICSGSSGSADVPRTIDKGLPVMMGEHSCIGDRANLAATSDLFMYSGGATSGNIVNPGGGQYMRVTALGKTHPILAGIPLDEQDRIKIFRDPYPEENAFLPSGGKPNYEYSWTAIDTTGTNNTDTLVLGVLDTNPAKSVFGVNDKGKLANGTTAPARFVHWIVNEDGSGGTRRMFNALTEAGKLIFVRTVKWAIGETLTPVQALKIKDITTSAAGRVTIRWDGTALKNYNVLAASDVTTTTWQTVVQDIHGVDGVNTRTLDITAGPSAAYMLLRAVP